MINYTATYTDKYQLTMAQVYFLNRQKSQLAIFDYFFRELPFAGGYAIFAGLEDLLGILEHLHFSKADIAFLHTQKFHPDFLNYLENFRFKGHLWACREGELIFPVGPVLSVEADIIEAQIIETIVLNILNFQTLIATKARRIRHVVHHRELMDYGLRRAQGPAGYYVSRASIIGGFNSTSNVCAGRDYHIPIAGTMAHSFIQSYDDELTAFRDYAEKWTDNCVLLVDTYSTLDSGVPNAIKVAKEMEARGHKLKGIRLDSGDLAYLAKRARQMLDQAGLHYVKIVASNKLDEHVIKSLLEQEAPIDSFGVGTHLAIGWPDSALDGVYKLAFANNKPRIKFSETPTKTTLPCKKQIYRVLDAGGNFLGADVIALADEEAIDIMYHPFEKTKSLCLKNYKKEPLLHEVMKNGKPSFPTQTLDEIAQYSEQRFSMLPDEYKRLVNPHLYKVGLSYNLKTQREQLIKKMRDSYS